MNTLLRPYQQETKQFVYTSWREGKKKVLIMLPCGSGKTIIAKSIIQDCLKSGFRVLFTCPWQVLVNQTYDEFKDFGTSVIMGRDKRYNPDAKLQIGSLLTVKNREITPPNVIILDESHYGYKTDMIQSLLARFPNSHIIGLSATPIDNKGYLLEGFQAYFDKYQTEDLQKLGFSAKPVVYSPVSVDLSRVSISNDGDFNEAELENEVIKEHLLKTVVENYIKLGQDRKFIAWATTQKHGQLLAQAFRDKNINIGYIDSRIGTKERDNILKEFAENKIKGLVNINILNAGFDMSDISCDVDAAPTMIESKYLQRRGRSARICEGKSDYIYIDCANNIELHDMPDKRRNFKFKPMVSRVIDRKLGLTDEIERNPEKHEVISEKMVELRRIGKLLDKYDGKVYKLEKDLQADVQNFLEKTQLFWFRQNSGVAQYGWALKKELSDFGKVFHGDLSATNKFVEFITRGQARFIRFTSKSGLADISCFMDCLYFGIELKLRSGKLTKHQQETIPEQVSKGILIFFAESVVDVFDIIAWVEKHWDGSRMDCGIYSLPEKQQEYYKKHKLKTYSELYDKYHCNNSEKYINLTKKMEKT